MATTEKHRNANNDWNTNTVHIDWLANNIKLFYNYTYTAH